MKVHHSFETILFNSVLDAIITNEMHPFPRGNKVFGTVFLFDGFAKDYFLIRII